MFPSSGLAPLVQSAIPKVVQLGARLVQAQVQVHVHHGRRVLLEIGSDLVKRLAPRLWHPEESEEDEEEDEHCENQEHVRAANVLRRNKEINTEVHGRDKVHLQII